MRRMMFTERLSRLTMGRCRSVAPAATTAILSRVSSPSGALLFSNKVFMAFTLLMATTASTTCSTRSWRRERALSAPSVTPLAMISRRSWSLSRGEYSRTGVATMSSMSRARRLMMSWGTLAASLISSAMMARTLGSSSRARISRTSRAMVVSRSVASSPRVGTRRPILAAIWARTSSSTSLARMTSACSGVPSFLATARRTSAASSVAK